ncbi:MAG: amidohydrolase family protein [Fimbriimonadaceae bacterium]|nr:amidohydrolase family protein [Fimbriimonadaceae bacterium]QYK57995.1 MAG: amidohydrolase family protein [Fimbriimonadaceae bacterium]
MVFRFFASVIAALMALGSLGQSPSPDFAVINVKVEDGLGRVLEGATVVVRGGRIESVGMEPSPAELPIVDGKGKTLYPGFIDAFSTRGLKLPPAPSTPSGPGQATPQTRPIRPGADTTAHGSMWEANRKGLAPEWKASDNLDFSPSEREVKSGVTALMLSSSRGSLRGQPVVVAALPAEEPGRVLAQTAGQAASFRIGPGSGYPGNVLGSIALLRQTLLDAQSHKAGARLWTGDKKPDWAASLEALQPALDGSARVFFEASQSREILRALALADEFGLRLVIVGGREAGLHAAELSKRQIPVVLTNDLGPEPGVEPSQNVPAADRQPEEFLKERHANWLKSARSAEALFEAKVPVAFASEGSDRGLLAGVRARIARGLDRNLALGALTIGAARILGIDQETGSVTPGKRADLVLLSGDFADPESTVERVWVAGRESKVEVKS